MLNSISIWLISSTIISLKLFNEAIPLIVIILIVKWSASIDILNIKVTPLALKYLWFVLVFHIFWGASLKFLDASWSISGQVTVEVTGGYWVKLLDACVNVTGRLTHEGCHLVTIGANGVALSVQLLNLSNLVYSVVFILVAARVRIVIILVNALIVLDCGGTSSLLEVF